MSSQETALRIVHFLRKRDYVLVRELGAGACGKTVLLRDDILDQHFVCKKYSPVDSSLRKSLFAAFATEVKLLHKLHHVNVVRVFNSYLYPETLTGFILLEHINGTHIDDYIRSHPEQINEVFTQVIDGFAFLEKNNVLHRDIRPGNVMVDNTGKVKIIDLGFGKQVSGPNDFNKSISLNWWCTIPEEFNSATYDFSTEVYFVGMLFDGLVRENDLEEFKYKEVLGRMCAWKASVRTRSFLEVQKTLATDRFLEIEFERSELEAYRQFADTIAEHITKLAAASKYIVDVERVKSGLEVAYQRVMLAESVPDAATVTGVIVSGPYYYKKAGFPVKVVRDFLRLLKSVSIEKQQIILTNLWCQLDAIPRYNPETQAAFDDDIPF